MGDKICKSKRCGDEFASIFSFYPLGKLQTNHVVLDKRSRKGNPREPQDIGESLRSDVQRKGYVNSSRSTHLTHELCICGAVLNLYQQGFDN